nr:YjcZ family sporulation protein [Alkalihalobacterium chitinilyticum]
MFGHGCGAYPVSPVLPGCAHTGPGFGYGPQVAGVGHGPRYGAGFSLIVVLFILLIIIGASWGHKKVC